MSLALSVLLLATTSVMLLSLTLFDSAQAAASDQPPSLSPRPSNRESYYDAMQKKAPQLRFRKRAATSGDIGDRLSTTAQPAADTAPTGSATAQATSSSGWKTFGYIARLATDVVSQLRAPLVPQHTDEEEVVVSPRRGSFSSAGNGEESSSSLASREAKHQKGGFFEHLASVNTRFGEAVLSSARAMHALRSPDSISVGSDIGAMMAMKRRHEAEKAAAVSGTSSGTHRGSGSKGKAKKPAAMPHHLASRFVVGRDGFVNHPKYPLRPKVPTTDASSPYYYPSDSLPTGLLEAVAGVRSSSTSDNDAQPAPASSTHRRSMRAQQSTGNVLTRTEEDGSLYIPVFCLKGLIAVPTNGTTFLCNLTGVEGTNLTEVTMDQFLLLNETTRTTMCTANSPRRQCICPKDYELYTSLFGDLDCIAKSVACTHEIVEPIRRCPNMTVIDVENEPVCFNTTRRASVTFKLNVSCSYSFTPDNVWAAVGVAIDPPPPNDEEMVVIGYGRDAKVANNSESNPPGVGLLWRGTYSNLSADAFRYWDKDPARDIFFSPDHGIVERGTSYFQLYSFRSPVDLAFFKQTAFRDNNTYVKGTLLGKAPLSHTFNLSNVPDTFLSANRMYMEAGLIITGGNIGADRMHIDFTDLPTPPNRPLKAGLSSGAVTAIVVVSVVVGVVLCISAFVGYRRWKKNQTSIEEEELD